MSQVAQVTLNISVQAPRYYSNDYCTASWKEYVNGKSYYEQFDFVCLF